MDINDSVDKIIPCDDQKRLENTQRVNLKTHETIDSELNQVRVPIF